MIWVWRGVAIMSGCIYRCLLTNRLHGKTAELCLANSCNNRVTTTKYISTLLTSTARYSFYHGPVMVKRKLDGVVDESSAD